MATKSKSAVVVDKRRIEVQEFSLPEIGEDDGLLRVEITGVCGSDYPVYTGDDGGRTPPPVILGHEIVGRVERLGARAAERWSVKEGDRVAMEEFVPCGRCYYCLTGHYNNCGNRPMMLGHVPTTSSPSLWGGYSEYLYPDPPVGAVQAFGLGASRSGASVPTDGQRSPLGPVGRGCQDWQYGGDPGAWPCRYGLRRGG